MHLKASGTVVVWVAIAVLMPMLIGSNTFRLGQLDFIASLLMVVAGLNIVLGFAGVIFLGPGALFAVAAYAGGVIATRYTSLSDLPVLCVFGIVASVIVAALAAIPSLRIGGFYLGMVTLFLTLVIPDLASHWSTTGGSNGISLIVDQSFTQHPQGTALYEVGIGLIVLMAGLTWLVRYSSLGRRFSAIQASEEMAQAVGIPPYRTKLVAFLLGAVPCGIGGIFYVYSEQFINPTAVNTNLTIYILAGLVIGGGGTILGPFVGMALVGAAVEFLGGFQKYQGIVYGVALIAVAIAAPRGLMGVWVQLKDRVLSRRESARPGAGTTTVAEQVESLLSTTNLVGRSRTDLLQGPPLVVTGARKTFGGVRALDGVDLSVEPGVVHALVGPNGSGKTTLLNMISGFYHLDGGEVTLGEHRLDRIKPAYVARLGVARTFQTPKLVLTATALQNVMIAADGRSSTSVAGSVLHTPGGLRGDRVAAERSEQALRSIGLDAYAETGAGLLPHGTQRLLEIARALALDPRFLLLDEPAAGLGTVEVEALKRVIRAVADAGIGVLLVEHNLPVVFGLANKVTVLHQGVVISAGLPNEVASDPEVLRVYVGRQGHREESAAPPASETVPARKSGQ